MKSLIHTISEKLIYTWVQEGAIFLKTFTQNLEKKS